MVRIRASVWVRVRVSFSFRIRVRLGLGLGLRSWPNAPHIATPHWLSSPPECIILKPSLL